MEDNIINHPSKENTHEGINLLQAGVLNSRAFPEFNQKLLFALGLFDVKTKEDLIRYIVCDGEPADESCIGHPVYASDDAYSEITETLVLNEIISINNIPRYFFDYGDHRKSINFAKKIPGYDYAQEVNK